MNTTTSSTDTNPLQAELKSLEEYRKELQDKLKLAEHTVWALKNIDLKGVEKKIERTKEMLK